MFIYKITVIPINQVYIGLDTKPSYKLSRWKSHCAESKNKCRTDLHKAMNLYGIKNCSLEILEDNFESLGQLALAEIKYIEQFNSYKNGLNSTPGGDGLGRHQLCQLSESEILKIKMSLGDNFRDYNKNIKWANTSIDDRKELTKHLHTEEVYRKKSETLKKFYVANPDIKAQKGEIIKQWQMQNLEKVKKQNKINSLKGAEKVSKKLKVALEGGEVLYFASKNEFRRQTGQWPDTIIKKTKQGLFHNGYKVWEM